MEFWILSGISTFQFPVPPSEVTLKTGQLNQVVQVSNFGEVNLWGQKKLNEISIESIFPAQRYSFVQSAALSDPWEYVDMVNKIKEKGGTARLLITDTKINFNAYIENFEYGIKDGTKDVWFHIDFKEFRQVYAPVADASSSSSSSSPQASTPPSPPPPAAPAKTSNTIYTVVSGDCLWNIAKKYYGDGSQYTKIYNANKDKINNPNLIYPGQQFIIP